MDQLNKRVNMACFTYTLIIVMAVHHLKILSYNSGGLGGYTRPLIHDLLCDSNADIVLLQETWLFKRDLGVLATLHKIYLGNGKSAIPDDTILHGRPYGGLGFLWRRSLSGNIRNIHVNCDRIDAILLIHDGSVTLIVNVYLPVDNRQMQHVSPSPPNFPNA